MDLEFWRSSGLLSAALGQMDNLDFWRSSGLLSAALGQTAFVILYLFWPWWETFFGRALFFKAVALAVLADVAIMGRIFDWVGEDVTFVILYWTLTLGIWGQFFAFLHVRRKNRQGGVSGNDGEN